MEDFEIVNEVKNLIKTYKHPSKMTTDGKEISVRCPYCGDSMKNPNSTHLYINLEPPFKFFCHHCNAEGILSGSVLQDLGIYNSSVSVNLAVSNRNLKKKLNYVNEEKIREIKLPIVETEASKKAVEYFNSRFETEFSNQYIVEKFKAITDAEEFFKENKIKTKKGYDFSKSIGFLSSDSSHVIFRDISGEQKTRYFNFALFPEDVNFSSKIYNIKSKIDLMEDEINLVMTEGIFDIIGVFEHFYKGTEKESNTIFAACCGKGYNGTILNYIKKGFLNLKITIYSDKDVDFSFFRELKQSSKFFRTSQIEIYYNKLEKDFGIPKSRIKLQRGIL